MLFVLCGKRYTGWKKVHHRRWYGGGLISGMDSSALLQSVIHFLSFDLLLFPESAKLAESSEKAKSAVSVKSAKSAESAKVRKSSVLHKSLMSFFSMAQQPE